MLIDDNRIYGLGRTLIEHVHSPVEAIVYLPIEHRPFRFKVQRAIEEALLDRLNRPLDNRNLYLEDTGICL